MTMPINQTPQTLPAGPVDVGAANNGAPANGMDEATRNEMLKQYIASQRLAAYQDQQSQPSLLGFLFKWTVILGTTIGGGVMLWKNRSNIGEMFSKTSKLLRGFKTEITNAKSLKDHAGKLEELAAGDTIRLSDLKGCEIIMSRKNQAEKGEILTNIIRTAVSTRHSKHATPVLRIYQNTAENQDTMSKAITEIIKIIEEGKLPDLKDFALLSQVDKVELGYKLARKSLGRIDTEVIAKEIVNETTNQSKKWFA